MIKLIIFDYDGVIVDSFSNVYEVYKIICDKLGSKFPQTIDGFRKIYGYSRFECYQNLGINQKDYVKASKIFKTEILKKEPRLFNGIEDVLKKLSEKYTLVLVSSNFKEEVEQKLKKFCLSDYFSFISAQSHHTKIPSKFRSITKVINKFKIKREEIIMIGDKDIDYDLAKKAGLDNILLVDYGWGYNKDKIKQRFLVKKPSDILKAIKELSI